MVLRRTGLVVVEPGGDQGHHFLDPVFLLTTTPTEEEVGAGKIGIETVLGKGSRLAEREGRTRAGKFLLASGPPGPRCAEVETASRPIITHGEYVARLEVEAQNA